MIGTMAAKKRKVLKKSPEVVTRKAPTLEELRRKPTGTHTYWCLWCYTEKAHVNATCPSCHAYGSTTTPKHMVSHVYVETIPES